jgi:hypothetical protein
MKTIKIYEKMEISKLKSILKQYEGGLEINELLLDELKAKKQNYDELKRISDDYEIDISLIRMELNRRLWDDNY